jgi:hypothetical protein
VTASFRTRRVTRQVQGGYFGFPALRGVRHFSLIAIDAAGNTSRPLGG